MGPGRKPRRPVFSERGSNNWGLKLTSSSVLDQLANLHFHFTSVPRCTPSGVEVQRNTDGDTPSTSVSAVVQNLGVFVNMMILINESGARWLSGRASDSGARGPGVRTPRPPYSVLEQDTLRFPKYWYFE